MDFWFSRRIGTCSAIVVELWGVYEGLKLAWSLGFNRVILESDYQAVIQLTNSRIDLGFKHNGLLNRISQMINRQWMVKSQHTYREGNFGVDTLYNLSLNVDFNLHV